MVEQTPEEMARDINRMAEQLGKDVDQHEPTEKILPEIRDMRRSLTTLESELIDGDDPERGDAC